MTDTPVGLADAIAALRQELLAAIDEGKGSRMQFRLAPVELSLQVTVSREAEGKIGWKVLGLGGALSSAATQTLKLTLEPVWRKEDGSYVSDFAIASQDDRMPRIGPSAPEAHLNADRRREGLADE
jgi:hypothetical protein